MAPKSAFYIFLALACTGVITQWGFMMQSGAFMSWLTARVRGEFPSGAKLNDIFTGIWPLDFVLGLLVTFFSSLLDLSALPHAGPLLLMLDLVFILQVFSVMTVVEDRRNRQSGTLRYPALWQVLNMSLGAASIVAIYFYQYVKRQSRPPGVLAESQAMALPLTTVWALLISLPIFLVPLAGGSNPTLQMAIVVWYFGPFSTGPLQDLASHAVAAPVRLRRVAHPGPVRAAYAIAGLVSGLVHLGITVSAVLTPGLSWAHIYWPTGTALPADADVLLRAAVLFTQYDFPVLYLSVFALGFYLFRAGPPGAAGPPQGRSWPLAQLVVISAVLGPGAGLAWVLAGRETEVAAVLEARSTR